ncbi:hypothetical protein A8A54_22045 [Brucella pseudogrignonensis]|nr:hypothetical protein A8A54_22045 [Brucella pseudogrignonensis]
MDKANDHLGQLGWSLDEDEMVSFGNRVEGGGFKKRRAGRDIFCQSDAVIFAGHKQRWCVKLDRGGSRLSLRHPFA